MLHMYISHKLFIHLHTRKVPLIPKLNGHCLEMVINCQTNDSNTSLPIKKNVP